LRIGFFSSFLALVLRNFCAWRDARTRVSREVAIGQLRFAAAVDGFRSGERNENDIGPADMAGSSVFSGAGV
jgi:hypothetical protein